MMRKSLVLLALVSCAPGVPGQVDVRDDVSMGEEMTRDEVEDWYLRNNFERFDRNNDGKLDGHEHNRYLRLHGRDDDDDDQGERCD